MKKAVLAALFAAVLGALLTGSPAHAQVPSSAEPGIVTRSLEGRGRPISESEEMLKLPGDDQAFPEAGGEKVFVLQKVILENATVYTAEDFRPVFAPFIGKKVSFADLNMIVNAMTRRYREDGYIFSRVVLPPQKIEDGILHVQAIEGSIARVEIAGSFRDKNNLIRSFADKIRAAGPANAKTIERYLLLMDDLPGVSVRAFMKPSEVKGAGDLAISVEQDFFEGAASIENRGSRYIGPWRGELVGAFNTLFGRHDRTTLRAIMTARTNELKFGEIVHEEQIGSEGLRVKGRYAITRTEPGGSISGLGIQGDSDVFDLEVLYPVLRGRGANFSLTAAFSSNDTATDLAGVEIARDRIRSLRVGGQLDFADRLRGINQFDLGLHKGVDILSATDDGPGRSRANAEHLFLRWSGTATRIQDLPVKGVSLFFSATGQYTHDPLPASEEFTLGGEGFLRAYDAGELVGDRGYAAIAEIRYGDMVESEFLKAYQVYAFVDYGRITNLDPVVGEAVHDSLTSVGIGARFNLARDISGYMEIDKPLNKDVDAENDDDTRVFFSLLKRF